MANILKKIFINIFSNENHHNFIKISQKFISKGLIDSVGSGNRLVLCRRQAIT